MNPASKSVIADTYSHLMPVTTKEVTERQAPKLKPKPKPKRVKAKCNKPQIEKVRWTKAEHDHLFDLRVKNVPYKVCARILGRSEKACKEYARTKYMLPDIKARQLELAKESLNG
tara:strand:- start:1086 stop:1430 length:345 start_codon:yes stop_codon:yes gene_type:complete